MKLIHNTGTDRVIGLLRPQLSPHCQFDVVTPDVSLFAFSAMRRKRDALAGCRLLLLSRRLEMNLEPKRVEATHATARAKL